MTTFYTRTGDDGYTSLLGEGRVAKYMPQPEAYGTVDEASAAMGVARAAAQSPRTRELLLTAQRDLYHMMAELAAAQHVAARFRKVDAARVQWLEQATDEIAARIELPREFVVPGDSLPGAYLDLARTIVRRAERLVVKLLHDGIIENAELARYLNRLSSLLFVLALYENALAGVSRVTLAKG
ncbi:MAG: cob(I)yrinic acid a,c-diamide adenosyltransferase [Thermoflexales bacterium]|nr:cob(I)yrinic acid a,c-diamide adenosyltransferase [Thermoflexales bacterium]MCS7324480.1 cob(I)yrinic acid a,c-diamide adenosyltransferase [Thermoflexales bacterium]MCX7939447.1 cob(I)yrinic acid a,c-diamide adenosyltransferase [Thermoflexales bacterium]MDW8054262.1 cob(I)yrinic acid a,c-diamide adenosyltransferase [Anaerolineae bacterium]MDW8292218.1 cob(I)yrinic acid a,c-diamide adenosyltransferase [Anaerolineae bacterium]